MKDWFARIAFLSLLLIPFVCSGCGSQNSPGVDEDFLTDSLLPPYYDSPYADAIDKGLEFVRIHADISVPYWQVYAVLNYLQRKFGLDQCYAVQSTLDVERHEYSDSSSMHLFYRMLYPGYIPDQKLEIDGTDLLHLMSRALYSDIYPLEASFYDELMAVLDEEIEIFGRPGYGATHVILCCQWMRELGTDQAFPQLADQWDTFASTLVDIAEIEGYSTDLAFEAMAFLHYIGYGHLVQDEWIKKVLSLQSPEGAWAYEPGEDNNGHPTVLAIWLLLEESLPNVEPVPWITLK